LLLAGFLSLPNKNNTKIALRKYLLLQINTGKQIEW